MYAPLSLLHSILGFHQMHMEVFQGKLDVVPHMFVLPEIKTIKYVIVGRRGEWDGEPELTKHFKAPLYAK